MSFPNLGHSRIFDRLRLPETFRSLATSFVGSWCLGILTYTEHGFGALAANLGCFPFDHEAYPS